MAEAASEFVPLAGAGPPFNDAGTRCQRHVGAVHAMILAGQSPPRTLMNATKQTQMRIRLARAVVCFGHLPLKAQEAFKILTSAAHDPSRVGLARSLGLVMKQSSDYAAQLAPERLLWHDTPKTKHDIVLTMQKLEVIWAHLNNMQTLVKRIHDGPPEVRHLTGA